MPYDMPSRTPMWPKVLGGLVPLLLVVGLAGWWVMGRESGYYLETADAKGIQAGDAVVRSGVRVGQVTGVKTEGDGAQVAFRLESDEELRFGDLLRIDRGLLSARAELAITRGCGELPGGQAPAPDPVPRGRTIEEAGRVAVMATLARCSQVGRQIESWMRNIELDDAVTGFRGALEQSKQWSGEAWRDGSAYLREQGEDLARRLDSSGLPAKADSVRQMMRERLGGR